MFKQGIYPHKYCPECAIDEDQGYVHWNTIPRDELCEDCLEKETIKDENLILSLQKLCMISLVSHNLVRPYKELNYIPRKFLQILKTEMLCKIINFFPPSVRQGLSTVLTINDIFKFYELVGEIMPNGTYYSQCKYVKDKHLHRFDLCSYCVDRKIELNKKLLKFQFSSFEAAEFLCKGVIHKNITLQWRCNFFRYGYTMHKHRAENRNQEPYLSWPFTSLLPRYRIYSPFREQTGQGQCPIYQSSNLLIFPVISDEEFTEDVRHFYRREYSPYKEYELSKFDDLMSEQVGLERTIMYHRENQVWPFVCYMFHENTFKITYKSE